MMRVLLCLFACTCLWLASCMAPASASLSSLLVAPSGVSPLLPVERIEAMTATLHSRSGQVRSRDGVAIFWRLLDPGDYHFHYRYRPAGIAASGQHDDAVHADFDIDFSAPSGPPPTPRGTVVLLHGWMMDGGSLLPWALDLAQAGYRTVSIDLRNHGRSGAGLSGYGTRESDDVASVIRSLREQGEISGPVYLLGVSYGAATALFTAQSMGDEISGVIAMESFANAGRAIRDMVPHMLARQPDDWLGQAQARLLRWHYGGQDMDAVIAEADARLGLDLDRVDVSRVVASAPACILLLHGDQDQHVPVAHGRLLAKSSARVRYIEMAGENHLSLPLRVDRLAPTVSDWLARTAHPRSHCPQPKLPA
ncbi:alpha/beta hydrolase [Pseudoxanthomonas dokdonensis]|uniref:Alpha/beta hydrolase n=1 Tax=Pseudoxanthomonas dokdonensis TaxID=344882 RepID=A0A0R0CZF8_9GAMM|nr:alpha/beta fold hydrolase [Pseudoxanthomonas dokdonensis]KRG71566.1 alpha/beta hydrolase [Pseudoxanthomonas dokdonensis]